MLLTNTLVCFQGPIAISFSKKKYSWIKQWFLQENVMEKILQYTYIDKEKVNAISNPSPIRPNAWYLLRVLIFIILLSILISILMATLQRTPLGNRNDRLFLKIKLRGGRGREGKQYGGCELLSLEPTLDPSGGTYL